MARPGTPVFARGRWPVALLLASVGLIAVAAIEALRTVRSSRAIADRALRDYASFAAWSYQQHLRDALGRAVREVLRPVNHGESMHMSPRIPPAAELAHYIRWDPRCYCHRTEDGPNPAIFFGFTLGSDTLGLGENLYPDPDGGWIVDEHALHDDRVRVRQRTGAERAPLVYTPAERAWVNDTLTKQIRSGFRSDWYYAVVIGRFGGQARPLAYVLMPMASGDTIVYGVEYTRAALDQGLARVLDTEGLLPATLTAGRRNRDLLRLEVLDRTGRSLFGWTPGGEWRLDASHALPASYGGLTVRAQIRPALAGQIIIGGLPRSRVPFLLGLLALATALSLVAVGQLRREGELARLRSDFVSSVSHELRTPLAQIRLYMETLRLDRFTSEEQRRRSLEHVERETGRLALLVENILRFSRSGRAQVQAAPEPLDVAREVREVVAEFEPLALARRARVVAEVDDAPELPMRPGALRQVLLNLLDNAVKYGPAGQTILVRLTTPPSAVRLAVEDEGLGVSPHERDAVWRPFHRGSAAARAVGGSGIGLTIVREIAGEHGGRAWVEGAAGGGARFVVELPVVGNGERGTGNGEERCVATGHSNGESSTSPFPAPRSPFPAA